jgi:FkbM family methyltransferase
MRLIPRLTSFGSTSIYIKRDNYEPELLAIRKFISDGNIVIDIGGSFGIFSLFMSSFVGPNGKVYTFEPGNLSYTELSANIALNQRGSRIIAHNVAASDHAHTVRLYHIANSPVNFSIGLTEGVAKIGVEYENVYADRVDAIVPLNEQEFVRFIKIDVEGYEVTALEGARNIIERSRPVIMFEVSTSALARQGLTPRNVYNFLREFKYSFYMLNQKKCLVPAPDVVEGNIFAIPPGFLYASSNLFDG